MMEEEILMELQGNRPRSRTWPLPQPEELDVSSKNEDEKSNTKLEGAKKGSRKNAWGNLSYADLITQAITSSPEQRMTLSQIYTWMVENIPYFKDKGDSTSSAGWKNSIRHNLSLHSRFARIQNEGNGKSSWWIVDHEAKAEKTKRRGRSSSLDSDANASKNKTKRGRKAKRGENGDELPQVRAGSSPRSPISGEPSVIVEDNPYPFPLADYRNRSSSNTSNVSSRLSPIPSHEEEDDTEMAVSPGQEHSAATPVVEELMDTMKDSLNMSMGQTHAEMPVAFQCSDESPTTLAPARMPVDPPVFVDSRFITTTADEFFQPRNSLKQPIFSPAKLATQNTFFNEQKQFRTSPNQFRLAERSVPGPLFTTRQERPPPYSQALRIHNPKTAPVVSRNSFQGNHCSQFVPISNHSVPVINVQTVDNLPVDTDIDFLEGDIECDVETVLRSELFNDGYLDFNLDNFVPSIAVPEMSHVQGYISGNMVH